MPTRIALIFFAFILALVSLAGCGGAQSPSAPALPSAADAQTAICTSLAAVNSGVDKLANINPSTTVADLKALKAPVDSAVAALKAANQVLNRPNITDLTTQYDSLSATINGLSDNASVGETAAAVQSGAVAVRDAINQARTALSCQ